MERYRIDADGAVYFVTFSVVEWLPVFVSERACRVVTDSFNFCYARKQLRVNAYVIMPTHLHAIVFDADYQPERLKQTLTDFRKYTGRRLCDLVDAAMPTCFGEVLHRNAAEDRRRRFWQASLHPIQLESEKFWQQKFDYLHVNPCRKGFVRRAVDWRFSSASYWLSDSPVANDVLHLSRLVW